METALDTVSFQHLLRTPRKSRNPQTQNSRYETSLDSPMRRGALRIVVDASGGLVDEWRKTCGHEAVAVILSRWEPIGGVMAIKDIPSIDRTVARELRRLGFNDTIDKLVLRLGIASSNKTVVSEDGDFWDPRMPSRRGDPSSPVARLCWSRLGVTVMLLKSLIEIFCSTKKSI